jgi:hypothetical protein
MDINNMLYIIGLFSYAMLMAGCIVWAGIGISWWLTMHDPYQLVFAIGMITAAIMFACLTLVVAQPIWLAPGALVPLTRIVAAITVATLGTTTAAYLKKITSINK